MWMPFCVLYCMIGLSALTEYWSCYWSFSLIRFSVWVKLCCFGFFFFPFFFVWSADLLYWLKCEWDRCYSLLGSLIKTALFFFFSNFWFILYATIWFCRLKIWTWRSFLWMNHIAFIYLYMCHLLIVVVANKKCFSLVIKSAFISRIHTWTISLFF